MEKEKDALEGGKKEAEEYLSQENQLTIKRSMWFQCYRHESAVNVSAASERMGEAQGKLKELQHSLIEAVDKAKDTEKVKRRKNSGTERGRTRNTETMDPEMMSLSRFNCQTQLIASIYYSCTHGS